MAVNVAASQAWGSIPFSLQVSISDAILIMEMTRAARELGAAQVLGLIPANWPRWTRRCGLDGTAAGPVMSLDGIDNQCVMLNLAEKLH